MSGTNDALLTVSIIVINHNYGDFLGEAVASALSQTYPQVEVVVVDDGSTDHSVELIRTFGAAVTPVLKPAGGHASAANAGFAASGGDIVIFLDADDRLRHECVAEVVRVWRADLAKVQYRLATIDREGRDRHMDFPYYAPDLCPQLVRAQALRTGFYGWPVSSGNAFARVFLQQLMPVRTDLPFPDGYLNKMAPLFGEVETLRAVLADYRVHGRNIWAQGSGPAVRGASVRRAVRSDKALQDEFADRAAVIGHQVPPYRTCPHVKMLESRMLSLRLALADHPEPDDGRWGLMWLGVGASRTAVDVSRVGRVLWAAWFVVMAVLPAAWLNRLFAAMRGQLQRPAWSRWLVALSRGAAAPSS